MRKKILASGTAAAVVIFASSLVIAANSDLDDFNRARHLTAADIPTGTPMYQAVDADGKMITLCLYHSDNRVALKEFNRDLLYCPQDDSSNVPLGIVGNKDLGRTVYTSIAMQDDVGDYHVVFGYFQILRQGIAKDGTPRWFRYTYEKVWGHSLTPTAPVSKPDEEHTYVISFSTTPVIQLTPDPKP